jgi:signal transduction histidine kinase
MPRREDPLFARAASLRVGPVELRDTDDPERLQGKLAQLVLAHATAASVALVDLDGRVRVRGAGAPDGDTLWSSQVGEDADALRGALARAARGEPVLLPSLALRPLRDAAGAVCLVLCEWHPAELEPAQALRARDAARFADLSHELRTPLTLILGPLEALRDASNLTGGQRRALEVVRRNATTLLAHVNQLFELSRLEAGDELVYCRLDLASLVTHTVGHFEVLAEQRGVTCSVELPPRFVVEVDPDRIQQVLINLVANAIELTPSGKHITVALRGPIDGGAELSVEDDGPGVPVEARERIFERYERGEAGARRLGGTGLGLAISKAIVDRHGGAIRVTDAGEGGGARFEVVLPTRAPEGTPVHDTRPTRGDLETVLRGTEAALEAVDSPPLRDDAGDLPRVLVVEDDEATRRLVTTSLRGRFTVRTAHDGEEGLARALTDPPDLVVTDVVMPRMSGDRLIEAMRARPALSEVPILVLSGRRDEALRIELLRRGAQDYVLKPFSTEELRARAWNLVSMRRARELLRSEVTSQREDIVELARAVTARSRELATAWQSMRVARDAAEAASRAKSRFLQLCSHELRTPLTTILLQLEMLEDEPLTADQRTRVRRLDGAARRLKHLVESLLEHARIETGRLPLEPRAFDVRAVVEDIARELGPRAARAGLSLDVDPESARLSSDPVFVRLVLLNLVDNAVKFTSRGGVRVRVASTGHGARVEVVDTGPGIPLEARLRIFDAFEQLEDVRHKHTPGIGLGLTLVQRIVEALGGRVDLVSEVGVGSTFVVDLPDLTR